MDVSKRKRLEAAGFKVGSAADFLGLSVEEKALIEVKLALAQSLKQQRAKQKLTQAQAARIVHSTQSRVAKMEAADEGVSIDLQIRALILMGVSRQALGEITARPISPSRH